jgi:AraC-like DNA-binding protein
MDDAALSESALSRFTRGLVRALVSAGTPAPEIAALAGLSEGALGNPFSDLTARRLWNAAPELTGDDDFGLHFAEAATLEELGIAGYIARASATIGDACSRIVHLQRLLKDADQLELRVDEHGATLVDLPRPDEPPWPRPLAEALLATWVLWPRRWVEGPCRMTSIAFQHARPARIDEHERIFACPIRFSAPRNELVFPSEVWALPLRTSDALLAHYLESAAVEEARRRRRADPFLARLERAIVDVMPSGELGADRVARTVGLSRRSLHRRLSERGLTYQSLVDDLRHRTARSLLDRGEHNITEVAFLVGFSDPSGFRRAYRRWTGRAPSSRPSA